MQQYMISVYQPDGPVPPAEILGPIAAKLDSLHAELKTAGAWVFTCGLQPPESATVLRARDGEVVMTDGPFAEGKEHIGGFTIIKAADLDAALDWSRRVAEITGLPVEARPLSDTETH